MATRITSIEQQHFNPSVLSLYWRFLAERQLVWFRRMSNLEAPWTADPILQVEFITNVYRILDPGTEYLINNILSEDASDEAKVFNVMLYRLMGSVPDTHRHIGFVNPDTYSAKKIITLLRGLPDDYRIFGDAYRVASYMSEGSDNKIDNVASMFGYIAGGIEETVRRIKSSRRVVEVYKVIETMQGFGEFLAHQVVVDLLYANHDGQKIVPFTDNEFAKAGPGARKGIWSLMDPEYKPANLTIVLEWLQANQEEQFRENGIHFIYLADSQGDHLPMSICDIQASLCEFYKYYRLYSGERSVQVRKYDGPHRILNERPVAFTDPRSNIDVLHMPWCWTGNRGEPDAVLDQIADPEIDEDDPTLDGLGDLKAASKHDSHTLELTTSDGRTVSITININLG